ncbi:hypothetical protein AVEN_198146-1 [Araneus ventricosus]|uniref:Uncharacterized protein n=1 Tax=Araneus ventricosus TaxID=182803 RepID=A0A4Y2JEK0_ARAVE|nr:hypothetical protein AVEN_198146-1 [Araneus ventricosus]
MKMIPADKHMEQFQYYLACLNELIQIEQINRLTRKIKRRINWLNKQRSPTSDIQTEMDYTESTTNDARSVGDNRKLYPRLRSFNNPDARKRFRYELASPRKAAKIHIIATEEPIATANKYAELQK